MIKKGKKRRQFLILAGVILPGIIISILGLYFVSQQKAARELNLKREYEKRITDLKNVIEEESLNLTREVYSGFDYSNVKFSEPSSVLQSVKSAVVANQIIKHPFIISANGNFIFPLSAGKSKEVLRSMDPALTDPVVRDLYLSGQRLEFRDKDLSGALKIYIKCLNLSGSRPAAPYIINAVGRCYFKAGKYHQALSYYRKLENEYAKTIDKDIPFRLTIIRQEALTQIRLGQLNEAVSLYLELYELIAEHETKSGPGQFEMYKNEALDQLSKFRRTKERAEEAGPLTENFPELDNITPIDRVIDWKFTDPENNNDLNENVSGTYGRDNFMKLSELYTPSDEKTWFYRTVRDIIRSGTSGNAIEIRHFLFFPENRKITISYKISDTDRKSDQVVIGFMINENHILDNIAPKYLLNAELDNSAEIRIEYDENINLSEQNRSGKFLLLSSAFSDVLSGYSIKIYSRDKNLFQTLANREVFINYGLILSLVLVLILGTILFQKYIIRESELLRSKSEFIDRVSHTLKTPLTRMRLLSENILSGWITDEKKREEFLKNIISETGRMNETINNMLNFSQIDSGKKLYKFRNISLKNVIEEYLKNNSEEFSEYKPGIKTDLEAGLPDIEADSDGILLIISNLVENSIKYSPEEKDIKITLKGDNENLILEVKDSGIGISSEDQKDIFKKFFRSGDNTVSAVEGSGLGLFLVAHAVSAHKGKIEVKSIPGKGSTFKVFLPFNDKMRG